MFDIGLYNDEFFQWHIDHAREYSINTMNWYLDEFKTSSICDIGCGIGSYLEAAFEKGLRDIKGYDIAEPAKKYTPANIQPFIEYRDCTRQIDFPRHYECVMSFETAEHIDPELSTVFVANITKAAGPNGRILFTGAPPGQQGCGHINCQPRGYWINLFSEFGFTYQPGYTRYISDAWRSIGCPSYIADNLLVFFTINKEK